MTRSRRRDVLVIVGDLLSILSRKGPIRKTRLMHLANLNPQSFTRLASRLSRLGLLETMCRKGVCLYTITRKGTFFLSLLHVLQRGLDVESETSQTDLESTAYATVIKAAKGLGLGHRVSSVVTGTTGTSYLHDIILTTKNKEILAVSMLFGNESSAIRQYELGAIMASCLDTQLPHLIIVPPGLEDYYRTMFSRLGTGCKTIIAVWQRDPIQESLRKLVGEELAPQQPALEHINRF